MDHSRSSDVSRDLLERFRHCKAARDTIYEFLGMHQTSSKATSTSIIRYLFNSFIKYRQLLRVRNETLNILDAMI